ncbi:MAG: hypothetical protein LBE18_00740, partial [Planctomycetaceae bacterium]|nr:hypothetical protein [Planctomycetaceae bacterium]
MKCNLKIFLFFAVILFISVKNITLSQESTFTSLDFEQYMKTLNEILSKNKQQIPKELIPLITITSDSTIYRNNFSSDSQIFVDIQRRMQKSLTGELVPDISFIANNTKLYKLNYKLKQKNLRKPKEVEIIDIIIDTAFTLFKFKSNKILVVCNARDEGASTMIYIKNDILPVGNTLKTEDFLSKKIIDLCNIERQKKMIIQSDIDLFRTAYSDNSGLPKIFMSNDNFLLVSPQFLPEELFPALFVRTDRWFTIINIIDTKTQETKLENQKINQIIQERKDLCKSSVLTESGRANLISLIGSDQRKAEFRGDTYRYNNYRELPYTALNEYYNNLNFNKRSKLGFTPIRILVISAPIENDALRKLLQSTDIEVKRYGLELIYVVNAKSLLPDLLKHATDKEQVIAPSSGITLPPTDPNFNRREYHFTLYGLLGKFGNQRTIKSLEQLRQSDKISAEAKEDADLAIELIKKNLDEEKRSKQSWLDWRRELREKKVVMIGGESMDFDKPDPEPISPEGFRKWETSEGLFKTTAKFVGLKEIKDKAG